MLHDQAVALLKEFVETDIRPIDTLALVTLAYVKVVGLDLNAEPELEQSIPGLLTSETEVRADFAFVLKHSAGVRRVCLRLGGETILAVEDLDPVTLEFCGERIIMPIEADDGAAAETTLDKAIALFRSDI